MSGIEGPPSGMSNKSKAIVRITLIGIIVVTVFGFAIWPMIPTEESRKSDEVREKIIKAAKVKREALDAEAINLRRITKSKWSPVDLYITEINGHEYIIQRGGGMLHSASCKQPTGTQH